MSKKKVHLQLEYPPVFRAPVTGGVTVGGRPLVNLTLAINYAWGGLNPVGYHVVNLVIHLLAALTLFGVVRRTASRSTLFAFAVALLWTVHPLQTESVSYVVQRAVGTDLQVFAQKYLFGPIGIPQSSYLWLRDRAGIFFRGR